MTAGKAALWGGLGLLLVLLLAMPRLVSQYYLAVLISMAYAVILAYGFRLIWVAGRFPLGPAAFVGMGAYTSAILSSRWETSFWLGLLLGGVVAALIAAAVGSIVLRVPGVYFVIMSFAIAEVFRYYVQWHRGLTHGLAGIKNIASPAIAFPGLPRYDFGIDRVPYYYLSLFLMGVAVLVMYRMEHSRIGLALHAMRQHDQLTEHLGINLAYYRVLAFVTASFFAGVVGVFQAPYMSYVSPLDFTIVQSLFVQVWAIVGGLASPLGPALGVVVVVGISEGFRFSREFQPLIYGAILIFIVLFLPRGLVGLPSAISTQVTRLRAKVKGPRVQPVQEG